jgi:SAM-dependent methyltransferase
MDQTYAALFSSAEQALAHQHEYDSDSYSSLLWQIEQPQIVSVLAQLRKSHSRIECLDFAAGTGRITAFLEDKVDAMTGIESNQSMCDIARTKLRKTNMLCADILSPDAAVEGKYDLITAFRFFLNVEPELRLPAMRALAGRLRDPSSRLIFNNHGNLVSSRLLKFPLYAARRLIHGRRSFGNYMSHGQVGRLLKSAGLRLVDRMSAGFYGATFLRLVGPARALPMEQRAASSRVLSRLCVNQMYIAQLQ